MFKKIVFLGFVTFSSLVAQTIDEIVQSAIDNNHSLKSMQESIAVASKNIELSTNWKNPTLILGANDIQFDDVSKRDLEPMQAEYIGFSQLIPMGDKLEIQEKIAHKESTIAKYAFEDKQLQLISKVYEYAYSIKVLEKKYALLNKYQKNIISQEKLLNALYENGKLSQVDLMNIKISNSNLQLKKESMKNRIDNLYLELEAITYSSIKSIDAPLEIKKLTLNTNIEQHPKILMIAQSSKKLRDVSKLENAKKNSDVKLNVAYFSRDSKYEDYANISIAIPLSLYGTENIKSLQAKIKAKEVDEKLTEIKQQFRTKIKTLQNSINSSYLKYTILKQNILPLKNEIQKNMEAYNSLDQIKPQETIKSLNEIISYELKSLDELNTYYRLVSNSRYFSKENSHDK